MRKLATRPGWAFSLQVADDFAAALEGLASGTADALAADDILIAGFLAGKDLRGRYAMVGNLLSYEPYGIMFAKGDAALRASVDAAFQRLAESGEIRRIYTRWFLQGLPTGVRLGLPMSPQLERSFEVMGLPP
jgi:glutamate/aspartate transport system substrate-binding protein